MKYRIVVKWDKTPTLAEVDRLKTFTLTGNNRRFLTEKCSEIMYAIGNVQYASVIAAPNS